VLLLTNTRRERFAQEFAQGRNADEAYEWADYKPDRGHASRLAANGNIQQRVKEASTSWRTTRGGDSREPYQ
jgi:phage terminase small subunit